MSDLKAQKASLRERFIKLRGGIGPESRSRRDDEISKAVLETGAYRSADTVLIYISSSVEVNTSNLIKQALDDNKTVAIPYCVPGKRELEFYLFDENTPLRPNKIGIMEPVPDVNRLVTSFSGSLCIVPAIACDYEGFRLGYGGGYYDRFLARYNGYTIAVVYDNCLTKSLSRGQFDIPVDAVATEKELFTTAKKPL